MESSVALDTTAQHLLEEIARLRRENASLIELNVALKEGNSALKDANSALKDLVCSLQNERLLLLPQQSERSFRDAMIQTYHDDTCITRLPQELLLRIFLATIPDDYVHDPSISSGPRNTWAVSVSTRRALSLVCKAWYGVATEALYADIVFRRMGQISALARTLRSARVLYGSDPSRFIKRIRMRQCLVRRKCAAVIKQDLAFVLQHCARLIDFEFQPHPQFDEGEADPDNPNSTYNPDWLWELNEGAPGIALVERCASGLRSLSILEGLNTERLSFIHHVLYKGTCLTSLVLGPILHSQGREFHFSLLSAVSLPCLKHLQIDASRQVVQDYIWDMWDAPNLIELTLLNCLDLPGRLLAQLGARLEYLHIVPSRNWSGSASYAVLASLEDHCPVLVHLALPSVPALNLPCEIVSPTLRYLDIWKAPPVQRRRVVELMCEMGHACGLPRLEAVRMFPIGIPVGVCADVPRVCRPKGLEGEETRVRIFPGTRLLETSWALLLETGLPRRCGVKFSAVGFDEDSDADSGSDFHPEDEDEDEDATSWVTEGEEDVIDDDLLEAEADAHSLVSELDRDTILDRNALGLEEDFLFDDD
ncbi:hypothetical protein C8Q79DRAFT_1008132 [Trametes meyenii]|nr:hypothetical protein C8Q79DRAFT_1008132 [Trametes meyenii]